MYKVGLTGGIGSGKSFVSQIFEVLGIPVYHADAEARRLMIENGGLRKQLITLLGNEVFSGSELNRKYIASMIFNDHDLLHRMNQLIHPAVHKDFSEWTKKKKGASYVMEEAAILFESGAASRMDLVIMVDAPEELRIRRVMERDGVVESEVKERISNQMENNKKRSLADMVIINDEHRLLIPQIINIHEQILLNIN